MKHMQLVDSKLFDDGSKDCLNFWITPLDGLTDTYMRDYEYIKRCFQGYIKDIDKAIESGQGYIQIPNCEITWG